MNRRGKILKEFFYIGKGLAFAVFIVFLMQGNCKSNGSNGNKSDDENSDLPIPADALNSEDLSYVGAFRLPAGISEVESFAWGGLAMTYFPGGNTSGYDDGFPGSLYISGHDWEYRIAEVDIPVPINSQAKNLLELNRASILQSFADIFGIGNLEIPRAGMAFLPAQAGQSSDKIHLCWGAHFQEADSMTHGWCELDLSNPGKRGDWFLDVPHHEYNTNDYLFTIPANWAAQYTPEKRLATGRFRDGGWSGQGPSLFAYGPWTQGDPPPHGAALENVVLLRYTSTEDYDEPVYTMSGYHHSDEWTGGEWLTAGNKAAVIFCGTKGLGDCWYGNQDGPCLDCENRGWWSDEFQGRMIFYDPRDFAKVATGEMESWEPQPYACLNIDPFLFNIQGSQQKEHTGAIAFDRERGYLYIVEFRADEDSPLIHVWHVDS